ncbi:FdtA/QdtA family cupin domain-containing protein [Aliifodinibius salicampi]|uniref:FdtA/QdtA family cupin domain-containing protein n=1 Tax=Fodinibius salicampi TaxID=1920655 RepID=A0ABT3Q0D9_9BACT|nr:FdtA/QdtA family cupin domain-containing protein [Fodinibius salicampi]MCW9713582.1 FdtA/QdtA family cupin domain-containing protein [Fodinibius salicampi]
MQTSTVYDSTLIQLPKVFNEKGNITAINNWEGIIPFTIDRVYYLYDIPGGEDRGGHAHKELEQLIIAASGSFDLMLSDGTTNKTFNLSRPYYGVYMPPGLWRELHNFSSGAICLVLASEKYEETDYIRDKEEFKRYKRNIENAFKEIS